MKRQRTSSFTAARAPTLPTVPAPAASTSSRRLSKAEKAEVKQMILKATPKSVTHNGPVAGTGPVAGVLASALTPILSFSRIDAGLGENQRRGDQIWIDKIHFSCYLTSTSVQDYVRFTVVRQSKSGFPPTAVIPADIFQTAGAGAPGIISSFQDDQPCEILYDKLVQVGNNTSIWGPKVHSFTLDFSKRPKKVVFTDNTAAPSVLDIVEGDITLICGTRSAATTSMTYVYDVTSHEK